MKYSVLFFALILNIFLVSAQEITGNSVTGEAVTGEATSHELSMGIYVVLNLPSLKIGRAHV
jgi:hypothetical protein